MSEKRIRYDRARAEDMFENIVLWWLRNYKSIFFVALIGISIWGGFLWYYSLYYFEWSPEQKQSYISAQSKRTVLNKKEFENVLSILDRRDGTYRSEPIVLKNIFTIDPGTK